MGKRNRRQKKGVMASDVPPSPALDRPAKITPDKSCGSENQKAVKSPPDSDGTPGKITDYFPRSPEGRGGQGDNPKITEEDAKFKAAVALPLPAGLLTPDTTPTKDARPRPARQASPQRRPDPEAPREGSSAAHRLEYGLVAASQEPAGEGEGRPDSAQADRQPTPAGTEKAAGKSSRKGRGRSRKAKQAAGQMQSPSLTLKDYYPVRRSNRQCKSAIEAEQTKRLHEAILSGLEEGVEVVEIPGKGRGVVATRVFQKGDFVVEYHGEHIDVAQARDREREYAANPSVGCYMYYYKHKNKSYCVDATAESGRLGRLLNHSKAGNCTTRLVSIQGRPYLILVAAKAVAAGEELVYDYGDRNKESLQSHPWLAF